MDTKRLTQLAGITTNWKGDVIRDEVVAESAIAVAELDIAAKPDKPEVEELKAKVPGEVKSELSKAVKSHLDSGNEMKAAGREQEAKFHFTCAEYMNQLKVLIDGGSEDCIKQAQLAALAGRSEIQNQLPKAVYDFLVPDAEITKGKSLQERFDEAQKARQGF